MARGHDYVILDTETTGLRSPAEIWEIAITTNSGIPMYNQMLRPVNGLTPTPTRDPSITWDTVKDCPTWTDIQSDLKYRLKGANIVVYNATFDRSMFHCSDESNGLAHFDWSNFAAWYCAMTAYSEFNGEWDDYHGNFAWKKLILAAARSGFVGDGKAHRALFDCQMTARVVDYMLAETSHLALDEIGIDIPDRDAGVNS
jgi:DNA polymerase III epsilon subunit-like protein